MVAQGVDQAHECHGALLVGLREGGDVARELLARGVTRRSLSSSPAARSAAALPGLSATAGSR